MARPTGNQAPLNIAEESDTSASLTWYEGFWELQTVVVSLEIRLDCVDTEMRGPLPLEKLCHSTNGMTACRIREGTWQGTLGAERALAGPLLVSECDDEGKVRRTARVGDSKLHWAEIDYTDLGPADAASRYLPPSFDLAPCYGQLRVTN